MFRNRKTVEQIADFCGMDLEEIRKIEKNMYRKESFHKKDCQQGSLFPSFHPAAGKSPCVPGFSRSG